MVNLGEVYQGIELSLKAYSDNVEKLFCVKPGASPEFIKVQVDGSKSLRVNQEGQLEADTELGLVKFTRPIAYQEIEGKRVDVDVEYRISNQKSTNSDSQNPKSEYGFTVASYDKTKDLIIDPLHASTFLGGSSNERGYSLTLDTSGNVYVTGETDSADFPTTSGAYERASNGFLDVFVSKLGSTLSAFSISPTSKSFTSGGGTGSVSVGVKSSNCSWTAVSNATWITVTSGGSGKGNGRVAYSVSANTGTSARTGTMTIAGKTFTVKQAK